VHVVRVALLQWRVREEEESGCETAAASKKKKAAQAEEGRPKHAACSRRIYARIVRVTVPPLRLCGVCLLPPLGCCPMPAGGWGVRGLTCAAGRKAAAGGAEQQERGAHSPQRRAEGTGAVGDGLSVLSSGVQSLGSPAVAPLDAAARASNL
jgi:hypothetical protein